jgi:hypothetical protein
MFSELLHACEVTTKVQKMFLYEGLGRDDMLCE